MKKLLLPLFLIALLSGCSSKAPVPSGEDPKDPDPVDPEPVNPEPDPDPVNPEPEDKYEEKTKEVVFKNASFTGQLVYDSTRESFVSWFNGDDDVLESLDCLGKCEMKSISDKANETRLWLGSQSETCTLTFNFKYDVSKIKLNIQSYSKYIAYSDSYSRDYNSVFILDGDSYDLSIPDTFEGDTLSKNVEKSYEESKTKKVELTNEGGRVFIHSIEITYLVEQNESV